ncbi:ankyrin repeat domain-containing protein [Leptospira sp. WS92.C1]
MKLILSIFVFFSFPAFLLSQDLSIEDRRFLSAAINGNLLMAKRALDNGASVNVRDPRANYLEQTPFIKSAWNNDVGFVQLLLEHKADVNLADSEGQTALIMAVYGLSVEVAKLLLTKKVDLYAETKSGLSAAIIASDLCSLPMLRMLKEAGVDLNRATKKGYRPLYVASSRCNRKFLKYIIESGADVNAIAEDGQTALFKAAKSGNRDALGILLERGASAKQIDKRGYNAFYYLRSIGQKDVTLVEQFLKAGLRLDQEYPDGKNVLMHLLSCGDFWLTYAESKNFDLNSKNRFGLSAFEYLNTEKIKFIDKNTSTPEFEKEITVFVDKRPFAALQISYLSMRLPESKELLRTLLLSILSTPRRVNLGALDSKLWELGFAVNDPEILKQLFEKYPDPPIGFWNLLPSFQKKYQFISNPKIPEDSFLLDLWLRSVEKEGPIYDDSSRIPRQFDVNQALDTAARECRVDILERLLKKKHLFKWKNYSSELNDFLENNQCEDEKKKNRILQLLLQIGADPGRTNWIWYSPICSILQSTIESGVKQAGTFLFNDIDNVSYQKNRKKLLQLLEIGGNPNCLLADYETDEVSTALEVAKFFRMKDLVKILNDFGAQETFRSELKLAIVNSDLERIKELVSRGAVIGYKELKSASGYDHRKIFPYLLDSYNALELPLILNLIFKGGTWWDPYKFVDSFSFKVRSHGYEEWGWVVSIFKGDALEETVHDVYSARAKCAYYYLIKYRDIHYQAFVSAYRDSREYSCRGFLSYPTWDKSTENIKINFFKKEHEETISRYGLKKIFPEMEEEHYFYYAPDLDTLMKNESFDWSF